MEKGGLGGYPERCQHGRVVWGRGLGREIAREWRRPGLNFPRKRTPDRNSTSDDTKRRHRTWEGRGESTGYGGRRTRRHHPGPSGDWDAGQGRQGGVEGVRWTESGRGRKGPL